MARPAVQRAVTLSLWFLVGLAPAASRAADATTRPAGDAAGAAPDAHVVLIAIDGLPAYLLNDPAAPIPTLRKLAAAGTAAEGMRVVNPSVTWPNHTTLITGVRPDKHSVLFNGVLTRPAPGRAVRVDPKQDQAALVKVPTLFELLKRSGCTTAAINWPCTRNAPAVDDNFPDVPEQVTYTTPRLRDELVAAGVLLEGTDKHFATLSGAAKDQVWAAAACDVIRRRKPNFMAFHVLICDAIHHRYGPQTPAGYAAVAFADAQVRDVLDALDDAGIREKTTVLVTADHGFMTAEKLVAPNVLFRNAGLLRLGPTTGVARAKAQIVSEGGTAMLYFPDPGTAAEDRAKAMELLKGQEGIAEVREPAQFAAMGLPDPATSPQMADLVLVAKEGYAFSGAATGEYVTETSAKNGTIGHHGFPADLPKMQALFIASGRGVRRGAKVGVLDNVDVAPTIAKLLGRTMPDGVDGKVLADVLEQPGVVR